MTNRSGTLYIGVTNDIARRVKEHRDGVSESFTRRYAMNRLLYVESTSGVTAAIEREKQLKGWTRKRKIELIKSLNPRWLDLAEEWFEQAPALGASIDKGQTLRSAQSDNSADRAPIRRPALAGTARNPKEQHHV